MDAELKYLVDTNKILESLNEEEQAIAVLIDTLKEMALVDRRDVPTIAELDLRLQNLYPKKQELQDKISDLERKLNNAETLTDKKAKLNDAGESLRIDEAIEEITKLRTQYLKELEPLISQKQRLENQISNLSYDIEEYSKPGNDLLHNLVDSKINDRQKKEAELEELKTKTVGYEDLLSDLDIKEKPLLQQKSVLEEKLTKEDGYVDKVKQHQLTDELNEYRNNLSEINVEIGKVLNNPIYLAAVAYEQLRNHSLEPLKNIINQLVSLANEIPYMDTLESDISTLDGIEKESISERNRSYRERKSTSVITKVLKERLSNINFDQTELEKSLLESYDTLEKKLEVVSQALETIDTETRRLEIEISCREIDFKPDTEQDKIKNEDEIKHLQEELETAKKLFSSYMDEYKSLKAERKAIKDVLGIMSNLKLLNNDEIKADLEAKVTAFEGLNIPSLVRKSEIDKKVEELTNAVIGIKHRKKFNSSPKEISDELNKKLKALQNQREAEIRAGLGLDTKYQENINPKVPEEEPVVVEEVPVVNLSNEEVVDYGMDGKVNNPFGEPVPAELEDTMEVPGFNPLDATAPQPVVSSSDTLGDELVKVVSMEPVGAKESEKDHQASFEDIIPKEEVTTTEPNFADLDSFLNGDFLQNTLSQGIKR